MNIPAKTCAVSTCSNPSHSSDLCTLHYSRWYAAKRPPIDAWIAAGGPTAKHWRDKQTTGVAVRSTQLAAAMHTTGPDADDVLVVADNPQQLVDAQHVLIDKMRGKFDAAVAAAREAAVVADQLVTAGLDARAARRRHKAATELVTYYHKAVAALEAGYVMVPDMPADTFAIRIGDRRKPRQRPSVRHNDWSARNSLDQESPDQLEAGHGRYVDPNPEFIVVDWPETKTDGTEVTRYQARGLNFDNQPIGIPARFQRPTVVQRIGHAMQKKTFDELATVDNQPWGTRQARRGDPMVVGYVNGPKNRSLCFLVAWFIDTAEL